MKCKGSHGDMRAFLLGSWVLLGSFLILVERIGRRQLGFMCPEWQIRSKDQGGCLVQIAQDETPPIPCRCDRCGSRTGSCRRHEQSCRANAGAAWVKRSSRSAK